MASRKPFVGGNWKMNLHREDALALAKALLEGLKGPQKAQVAIFPAFPYLAEVGQLLKGQDTILLGAQDFHTEANGAYTGEVSLSMLKDVGVQVVLAGHSERRHVLGESDALVNAKVRAALAAGLEVILCVGEKLEQREKGMTDAINYGQTALGLAGVTADQMSRVTLAYEPVWAIGTGKTAMPSDAQVAHERIRGFIRFGLFNDLVADGLRIQYGGSVKGDNAKELFSQADVDGGLIGGASLKAAEFIKIVQAVKG